MLKNLKNWYKNNLGDIIFYLIVLIGLCAAAYRVYDCNKTEKEEIQNLSYNAYRIEHGKTGNNDYSDLVITMFEFSAFNETIEQAEEFYEDRILSSGIEFDSLQRKYINKCLDEINRRKKIYNNEIKVVQGDAKDEN